MHAGDVPHAEIDEGTYPHRLVLTAVMRPSLWRDHL